MAYIAMAAAFLFGFGVGALIFRRGSGGGSERKAAETYEAGEKEAFDLLLGYNADIAYGVKRMED